MKKTHKMINYKRILNHLLTLALFLFLSYTASGAWLEQLDMIINSKNEPATAMVYDKTAHKWLDGDIYYSATLEENLAEQTIASVAEGQKASLTKEQFKTLVRGDMIEGFTIDQKFYVATDIKDEINSLWIPLAILSVYPVGYILYVLTRFKIVNEILDRFAERFDKVLTFLIYTIMFGGIIILLLFSFYSLAGAVKNVYERTSSDLIETTAEVTHHDTSSGPRDRRYYIALSFENELSESIHVTKEVTPHTYYNAIGKTRIMYKRDNPYNVFMKEQSFKDLFQISISNTMITYYLTIFLTAILLFTVYLLDKNRRTGSYW